ncbi:MAG: hypothetical protein BGN84_16920 [Afipia sp. 62-7]|nr:MAG: hypothetical protein BGN84_16920 [Afipia sp. 62-7]
MLLGVSNCDGDIQANLYDFGVAMKTRIAIAALIASTVCASADTLTARHNSTTAVAAPIYNWSGFYAGLSAGYGIGKFKDNVSDDSDDYRHFDTDKNGTGFVGGLQAGYNLQFGRGLIGIEADFSYSDVNRTSDVFGDFRRYTSKMEVPWFGLSADVSDSCQPTRC